MRTRVFSTSDGAKRIRQKDSRLREAVRNRYLTPRRLSNGVIAWSEANLEVVRIAAFAIDSGAPHYAVRILSARLEKLDSAEAVRSYAANCALIREEGLWRLADSHLDSGAMEMAKMAEKSITFTRRPNIETE